MEPTAVIEDRYYDFGEIEGEAIQNILNEYDRGEEQPWEVFSAARLKRIYEDFVKRGFVRDQAGLMKLADLIVKNVARLHVNTVLSGHSAINPVEYVEAYRDISIEEADKIAAWIPEHRYSDFAMKPLVGDAMMILSAFSDTDRMLAVDRAINRIHRRGDIAAFFIDGGFTTLNALAGLPQKELVVRDKRGRIIPPSKRF